MVRREPQCLFSWITCMAVNHTSANTVTPWMARTLKCAKASSRYLQFCNCIFLRCVGICFKILSLGQIPSHTFRCLPLIGHKINATLSFPMEKILSAFEFFAIGDNPGAFILCTVKGGGEHRKRIASGDVSGHHTPDKACKFSSYGCFCSVFVFALKYHTEISSPQAFICFIGICNYFGRAAILTCF